MLVNGAPADISLGWVVIGSGNGLSPMPHKAIICTNADSSSVETLGTNFSEIESKHNIFLVKILVE